MKIQFTNPVSFVEPLKAPVFYQVNGFGHNLDLENSILHSSQEDKPEKTLKSLSLSPSIALDEFENLSLGKMDAKMELGTIFNNNSSVAPQQVLPIKVASSQSIESVSATKPLDNTAALMIAYKISAIKNEPHTKYIDIAQSLIDMGFDEPAIVRTLQKHSKLDDAVNALL
eukprot:NODE_310_length_11257_cov_0.344417.p5 type:complete len:171 gc:universal NODE_310_length_11257_cov_0.344417:5315-4803(-)